MSETNDLAVLGTVIRPFLQELAHELDCCSGIVGVVFREPEGERPIAEGDVYFAEFVNFTAEMANDTVNCHYVLPRSNILSVELLCKVPDSDNESPPPTAIDMELIENCGLKEIAEPVCILFGSDGSTPRHVQIWRAWLRRPTSMLYFLPQSQTEPASWTKLPQQLRFIAYFLRQSILMATWSQRLEQDLATALTRCLPNSFLQNYEDRLHSLVDRWMLLEERARSDVRDLRFEIDWTEHDNRLKFTAFVSDGSRVELFSINCMKGMKLSSKAGSKLVVGAPKKRQRVQTLAFYMICRAFSSQQGVVNDVAAIRFFEETEDLDVIASSGKDASKTIKDRISKRIERAESHLRELLSLNADVEFFKNSRGGRVFTRMTRFTDNLTNVLKSTEQEISQVSKAFLIGLIEECESCLVRK